MRNETGVVYKLKDVLIYHSSHFVYIDKGLYLFATSSFRQSFSLKLGLDMVLK